MSHGNLPKDPTSPLAYIPIVLFAVGFVSWVFASGYQRGVQHALHADPSEKMKVEEEKPAPNIRAMAESTPDLVLRGKGVFEANCASCHGKEGKGDGEKGVGLNPPPRNYHNADGWTNGRKLTDIWKTLESGARGSMASYKWMNPVDRIAVSHYISLWIPEQPAPTSEDLASLPAGGGAAGGPVELVAPDPLIPYDQAIAELERPTRAPIVQVGTHAAATTPGAELFAANCAGCHGAQGGGIAANRVVGSWPYVRVSTEPLAGSKNAWTSDEKVFEALVVKALPGRDYHGFATMTRNELKDLHEFTRALARKGN